MTRLLLEESGLSFGRWRGQLHVILSLQRLARGEGCSGSPWTWAMECRAVLSPCSARPWASRQRVTWRAASGCRRQPRPRRPSHCTRSRRPISAANRNADITVPAPGFHTLGSSRQTQFLAQTHAHFGQHLALADHRHADGCPWPGYSRERAPDFPRLQVTRHVERLQLLADWHVAKAASVACR